MPPVSIGSLAKPVSAFPATLLIVCMVAMSCTGESNTQLAIDDNLPTHNTIPNPDELASLTGGSNSPLTQEIYYESPLGAWLAVSDGSSDFCFVFMDRLPPRNELVASQLCSSEEPFNRTGLVGFIFTPELTTNFALLPPSFRGKVPELIDGELDTSTLDVRYLSDRLVIVSRETISANLAAEPTTEGNEFPTLFEIGCSQCTRTVEVK